MLNVSPLVQRNERKAHFLKLRVTFLLRRKQVFFESHPSFKLRAFPIALQRQAALSYYFLWESAISTDFSNAVSNSVTEVRTACYVWGFVSCLKSGLKGTTNVFGYVTFIPDFLSCGYCLAQWDTRNTSTFSCSYRASWYYQVFYPPINAIVSCLKNSIKIYIKIYIETAPTCFGVTVTPSSGSAINSCLLKLLKYSIQIHRCVVDTMIVWLLILGQPHSTIILYTSKMCTLL